MATSVSFINMKGGVGKTTLAMQTSLAAAQKGYRVLAVDLDPQSNLSQSLMGVPKYVSHLREHRPTIVQIFDQYVPPSKENPSPKPVDIRDVILAKSGRAWGLNNLDLIPSRLELSRTLKNPAQKERRLAKELAKVVEDYDLIVIDCAPTESILTDAAYFASRYVLVPVKPEFLATIGLPLLARSIDDFQHENEDHEIELCGIVFNHPTYGMGPEVRQSMIDVTNEAKKHGWRVFSNHIKYSKSYPRAAREGSFISNTSNAQWPTGRNFSEYMSEFISSINLEAKQ